MTSIMLMTYLTFHCNRYRIDVAILNRKANVSMRDGQCKISMQWNNLNEEKLFSKVSFCSSVSGKYFTDPVKARPGW